MGVQGLPQLHSKFVGSQGYRDHVKGRKEGRGGRRGREERGMEGWKRRREEGRRENAEKGKRGREGGRGDQDILNKSVKTKLSHKNLNPNRHPPVDCSEGPWSSFSAHFPCEIKVKTIIPQKK